MTNTDYIGDGVYATFDGFGIELRVNDHRSPMAVYLEPDVLRSLIRFYERQIASGGPPPPQPIDFSEANRPASDFLELPPMTISEEQSKLFKP